MAVIIFCVKELLTSTATGLVLSTLIFPVLRSGDTLEQLISRWGSYLNKICLHLFLSLAECVHSRSGHYLLLAVLHRWKNKDKFCAWVSVCYYRQQLQQLNRCTTRWLYANGMPQKWFYVKSSFRILKLYLLAVSLDSTLRVQPWRSLVSIIISVRRWEVVLDSSLLWHVAEQDRSGEVFTFSPDFRDSTHHGEEGGAQWSISHHGGQKSKRTPGPAGSSSYAIHIPYTPPCGSFSLSQRCV